MRCKCTVENNHNFAFLLNVKEILAKYYCQQGCISKEQRTQIKFNRFVIEVFMTFKVFILFKYRIGIFYHVGWRWMKSINFRSYKARIEIC